MHTILSKLDADALAGFASALAPRLLPGDTLLLNGPVGAGKSHFARVVILAILDEFGIIEDVPSPTFTLVQTYETPRAAIWHADLYRLSHLDEIIELGLDDAFETGICLVEWAEKLGTTTPSDAMVLTLIQNGEEARDLQLEWKAAKWKSRLDGLI